MPECASTNIHVIDTQIQKTQQDKSDTQPEIVSAPENSSISQQLNPFQLKEKS